MILQTKYQDSMPCGFKVEDFFHVAPYISLCKTCDPVGWGHLWPQCFTFNKLGKGLLGGATYQISKL